MQTRYKAAIALLVSIVGFFLSSPYAESGFVGGLIYHGFLAAMVGGLADWFAVTALFRKPLGIAYRTDILRRNRPRIMQALVDFAGSDLLNTANIMAVIREQDMAQTMASYLTQRGGRERLKQALTQVLAAVARTMDVRSAAQQLVPVLRSFLQTDSLDQTAIRFLQMLGEERCSRKLLPAWAGVGKQVLVSPAVQSLLLAHITAFRTQYEKDSFGRSFLIGALGLSDEKMLQMLNQQLLSRLTAIETGEGALSGQAAAGLQQAMSWLGREPAVLAALRQWKDKQLSALPLEDMVTAWLEQLLRGEKPVWLDEVNQFVDDKVAVFMSNASWQRRYDEMVKRIIEQELTARHDVITTLIQTRLDELSDDKLIAFIEAKIADDLQMIRINGSIVGSLVGMLLYVIVFGVERVCG